MLGLTKYIFNIRYNIRYIIDKNVTIHSRVLGFPKNNNISLLKLIDHLHITESTIHLLPNFSFDFVYQDDQLGTCF